MLKHKIEYECDCCGRKVYCDSADSISTNVIPSNWTHMPPFGDICERCFSEFQDLYDRIHAPIRARQLSRPVDEETFDPTQNWEPNPLNYFPEEPTFPH